jgi:hypothetical protein
MTFKEFIAGLFGGKLKPATDWERQGAEQGYSALHNDFASVLGVERYRPGASIFDRSELIRGREGWQRKIDRE